MTYLRSRQRFYQVHIERNEAFFFDSSYGLAAALDVKPTIDLLSQEDKDTLSYDISSILNITHNHSAVEVLTAFFLNVCEYLVFAFGLLCGFLKIKVF